MANFDTFELEGSLKNIPIASKNEYLLRLIEKTRSFIRRLRWKAHFFEQDQEIERKETFGLPSRRNTKAGMNLINFENDLFRVIANIEFHRKFENFQHKLLNDVKRIRKSTDIIVKADKTPNLYKLTRYIKLLHSNITKNYKKASQNTVNNINKEAKTLAQDLEISDRIQCLAPKDAYITLKDHKDNFKFNPKCRLINPTKSEIGIISKKILNKINDSIRNQQLHTQWTNTEQVLKWFKSLPKNKYQFLKFDVVEYYPSISRNLLEKALNFAEKYTTISKQDRNIIFNAAKSVLFHDGSAWIKRNANSKTEELFDVAMGSYDGAEVCELVGLFMLEGINNIIPNSKVGIYRDDGLAAIPKQPARTTEKLTKKLHAYAKSIGLRLEIEPPSTRVEFLDVTLDLTSHTFWPFRKPNSEIKYINKGSNHPKNITNQMRPMIQNLISKRSINKEEFDKAAPIYNKALTEHGYDGNISYQNEPTSRKNKRKRTRIWFNPPFCKSVKTNLGKVFIGLVKKHFDKNNPLSKIINIHKIGFSYSCMPNLEQIISSHNKKILAKSEQSTVEPCNCRNKTQCPMKDQSSCRVKGVIYKATVATSTDKKTYIGLAATEFKARFSNHKSSFNNEKKKKATALAGYIHQMKDEGKEYDLTWKIIDKASGPKAGTRTCRLCLKEARAILRGGTGSLNKRSEIAGACRHVTKFYLDEWDPNKTGIG